jgi:hypothetical protein
MHAVAQFNGVDLSRLGVFQVELLRPFAGLDHVFAIHLGVDAADLAAFDHVRDRVKQLCAGGETEIRLSDPDFESVGRLVGQASVFVATRNREGPPLLALLGAYFERSEPDPADV